MPLSVSSLCRYFANRSLQWRPEDFDAYMWVQALKGNQLNGYAHVPVEGVRKRLSNQNLASAIDWFGKMPHCSGASSACVGSARRSRSRPARQVPQTGLTPPRQERAGYGNSPR